MDSDRPKHTTNIMETIKKIHFVLKNGTNRNIDTIIHTSNAFVYNTNEI